MTKRRRPAASTRLARQAAELSFAAPVVIAHRLARMGAAGPSPSARDRREFERMTSEKVLAFYQSWAAMGMQAYANQIALTQSLARSAMRAMMTGMAPMPAMKRTVRRHAPSDMTRILAAGIGPVHRAAVANAKRLSRGRK
jgi:hypothetical protein